MGGIVKTWKRNSTHHQSSIHSSELAFALLSLLRFSDFNYFITISSSLEATRMDKKALHSPKPYQYALYGLTGFVFLSGCLLINPIRHPVYGFALLLLMGALTVLLYRLFKLVKRYKTDYDEMKVQSSRHQLVAKRKGRLAAYFDRVLRDAADMIFTLDIDGYILKFNTGAETLLGFRQHEIVGKPFTDVLLNPEDSTAIFDLVLQSDRVQNHEVRMKAKDGHILQVSMSISEMRDEKSQIMGMVATCKDITENKRLESELIRMNKQLQ